MADNVRFWVHTQLAKEICDELKILNEEQFQEVAWKQVCEAITSTPRMFQIWACKQVTHIAGVCFVQDKYKKDQDKKCLRCGKEVETCAHVLNCKEEGRVKALTKYIQLVDQWMKNAETYDTLRTCLVRYVK